jgi:hypothetical protein
MTRRRRKKLAAPESIERVLARAGEDRFAPNRAPIAPHVWAAAVGARIAERTRPIAVENGVLIVRTATSVWASELSLLSEALLGRLRTAGIKVRGLRFRVGAVEPPEHAAELRTTKVPRAIPLDPRIARTIAQVEDVELREAITLAARTNLAWQAFNASGAQGSSGAPRAARAPRDAETGNAPPDRTRSTSPGAGRGTRGDG